jgi:mycothiol system anti-sigma-R factor
MNCAAFEARLQPYVDGELPVAETTAADAHLAECPACAEAARAERELRALLRRQPREAAPPELRVRVTARLRRERRLRRASRLAGLGLATALVALVVGLALRGGGPEPGVLDDLVDKHVAYAQLERPAELASSDPDEIRGWFRERAGLSVGVPDYSSAGIRLLGARLSETHERRAAYLLYEKGRTLLSIFVVPLGTRRVRLGGATRAYRGHDYVTLETRGYRTVAWTDGATLFGLVSLLDYDALLECADRLRLERGERLRL